MATNQMRREAAKRKLERQQERRAQQVKRRQRVAVITSVAVVVVVVVGIVVFTTLSGGEEAPPAAAPDNPVPTEVAPVPVRSAALPNPTTCDYVAGGEAAKPAQLPSGTDVSSEGTVAVDVQTSAGAIPLTLDRALAPCTVNSFVSLASQGYYDGTPCHRLTTSPGLQVLQCGDPSGSGSGGPGYTIPDEIFPELSYGRGILAMAKTAAPNSGGSQFFMVYGSAQLPPEYTTFGTIEASGLEVLDTIAQAGSTPAGDGAPTQPVTIDSATVAE